MESRVLGLGKYMAPTEIVAFHPVYGLRDVFQSLPDFQCLSAIFS